MMDYNSSVTNSRNRAHEENTWGKPANDIINGIGNIRTVYPSRGIWELVQNARDVVKRGERATIVFTRNDDNFIFQHDGTPFTWKTLEALILQTSSKSDADSAQVGQYGTGFLTTHKFGLKFYLSAPLKLADDEELYYNFKDFLIDRSATEKEKMREAIKSQWEETGKWEHSDKCTRIPARHTIFKYLCEHDAEKKNVEEAFLKSPKLVPFVLLLNDNIESITFVDNVRVITQTYKRENSTWECVKEMDKGNIYSTTINDEEYFVIKSKERATKNPNAEKILIILPITKEQDSIKALNLGKDIPQLYINLPLLGTTNWGLDFMFHSPDFTCDTDKRDNLRFIGNGQNNDNQAEENKNIISLGKELIFEFIDQYVDSIIDAKYLVRDSFIVKQGEEELGNYYKNIRSEFREKYKTLRIAYQKNGEKVEVEKIKVLDPELVTACQNEEIGGGELLSAIYSLLDYHKDIIKPIQEDMLYWSETIEGWYKEEENPQVLDLEGIAKLLSETKISEIDTNWVFTICQYIANAKSDYLFDKYAIVPNENYVLHLLNPLLKPANFKTVVKDALVAMVPEKVELFLHPKYTELFPSQIVYGCKDAKEDITNFINNHNSEQNNSRRSYIKTEKLIETNGGSAFYSDKYLEYIYSANVYTAIIRLYQSLLPKDGENFPRNLFPLILDFYNLKSSEEVDCIDKDPSFLRTCYTTLIYDSLFRFTIEKDKSAHSNWSKSMVETIYSFSDTRDVISNYQVYPNQKREYKYAEWLKKQPSDLPDRVIELYDAMISPASSLKAELVDKSYSNMFVGQNILSSAEICGKIEEIIKNRRYEITDYDKQNLIVEIIENLSMNDDKGKLWRRLFSDIDDHKGQIMFSIIKSQSKKESIFQIMKVKDDNRLKLIASLAERDDLQELIEEGEKALVQKRNEENDNQYKKDLGEYVESFLVKSLGKELKVRLDAEAIDEQGGQDIIVYKDEKPVYYIEVKSRWSNDRSVLMSTMQYQRSIENPDRYALTCANMYGFDRSYVDKHEYPPFDEIIPRIRVLENIGSYNQGLIKKVANEQMDPHVNPGYQILVPQDLINSEEGKGLDVFLEDLVEIIRKG